jgi:hypothetical protein
MAFSSERKYAKITLFLDVILCSLVNIGNILEEPAASIFTATFSS